MTGRGGTGARQEAGGWWRVDVAVWWVALRWRAYAWHDRGGADMLFGGGQQGRRKGPDAHVDTDVTLEELYNGGQRSVKCESAERPCGSGVPVTLFHAQVAAQRHLPQVPRHRREGRADEEVHVRRGERGCLVAASVSWHVSV